MEMKDSIPLEVRRLSKAYRDRPVLVEVELAVGPGESIAVLGPNGAGKSTFLGCITADRLPDSGEVRICGIDPFSDLPSAAGCMGIVPEQPFLYDELAVGEFLQFVTAARGMDPVRVGRELDRLLALLGLAGTEGLLCRELSQGMGRKVALISALLHAPRLIILDEAFNGLDAPSADRLREELERRLSAGTAVLLSSHDLAFVGDWCNRGLLLGAGGGWKLLEGAEWRAWGSAPSLGIDGTSENDLR
jgi:ABC-2 type transport system ATP-binding protein